MKPRKALSGLAFLVAYPLSAAEVLYYSMEDSSSPLIDAVGNLEAIAVDSGHLYEVDGPPGFGKAVALSGNGAWQLSVADSAVMRDLANNFSVAVWVYLDSAVIASKTGTSSEFNRVVGDDVAWDADGWSLGVRNDGRVRFTKNGIVDIDLGAAGAVPTDEWAHIAATVSSTEGSKLFVNGIPVGTNSNTANCRTGVGNNGVLDAWALGRSYGNSQAQWFAGRIDELRVFNHVLTEGQVAALMVVSRDPALVTDLLVTTQGSVRTLETISLAIENDGESNDLDISGVTFSGPNASDFSQGTLPTSIAPGGQGSVEINFSPSAGSGVYSAKALIASNDPQKPSFEVTLEITVLDPFIRLEGDLNFGEVLTSPTSRVVTVFNEGLAADLFVNATRMGGFRGQFYSVNPSSLTVAPGESATLTVTFDPDGNNGIFKGTLEVDSNDAGNPTSSLNAIASIPLGSSSNHLRSHFTFDQSTALGQDLGLFGLDGTAVGDAAFTSDARIGGGALLLDGFGDHIFVGGAAEYSSLDDNGVGFTVAAWVWLDENASGIARIFSTFMDGPFAPAGWGVGFGVESSNALLATAYGRADYLSPDNTRPTSGEWHHLTYVFRNAPLDEIEFFMDGVSLGVVPNPRDLGLNDTTRGFAIGSIGIPGLLQNFYGKIDDLRIYDVELTDEEIVALANAQELGGGLKIIATEHLGNSFRITWNSLPGRQYLVSRSFNDPISGLKALETWEEISGLLEATDSTTNFLDGFLPANAGSVFYRVSEAP